MSCQALKQGDHSDEKVVRFSGDEPSSLGTEACIAAQYVESSSQDRRRLSENLAPLLVGTTATSLDTAGIAGAQTITESITYSRLSLNSDRIVNSRIEELSQLESPQLRELARRLASMYKIESPQKEASKQTANRKHPYTSYEVGVRWEEIQGSNRWDGLLDPIDPVLRAEIIRYGEFAQATYDCFDSDVESKYCGSCKYPKKELLEKVRLANRGYEITDYLYATSRINLPTILPRTHRKDAWSKDSNWIGFVAICTSPEEIARLGRRDILVAWRGTIRISEWIQDIQDYMAPTGFDPRHTDVDVMVESGFLSVYKSNNEESRYNKTSARVQVLGAVKALVEKYANLGKLGITVVGHSLGSALATLCAYDIAESGMNLLSDSPRVPSDWNAENLKPTGFEAPELAKSNLADGLELKDNDEHYQAPELATSNLADGLGLKDDEHYQAPELATSNLADGLELKDDHHDGSDDGDSDQYEIHFADSNANKFSSNRVPITVYSFAGPRVGNRAFRNKVEELGVAVLRVVNIHDVVPKMPGFIFSDKLAGLQKLLRFIPSYKHVGIVLRVDHSISPFLRSSRDPAICHNLEIYLHTVDGFGGADAPFKQTMRDFALVNKGTNFLKHEFFIPSKWWQEENKGLVRDNDGHWLVPVRDPEAYPPSPQSPEEEAEEQDRHFERFWRSVSIAADRSTAEPWKELQRH